MKHQLSMLLGSQQPQAIWVCSRMWGLGVGSTNEKDQVDIGWGCEGFGFPDSVFT